MNSWPTSEIQMIERITKLIFDAQKLSSSASASSGPPFCKAIATNRSQSEQPHL